MDRQNWKKILRKSYCWQFKNIYFSHYRNKTWKIWSILKENKFWFIWKAFLLIVGGISKGRHLIFCSRVCKIMDYSHCIKEIFWIKLVRARFLTNNGILFALLSSRRYRFLRWAKSKNNNHNKNRRWIKDTFKDKGKGTSLAAQWLRICLPMQGTWVQALVQEDPICRGATKPASHNCWACVLQLLKPARLEPVLCNKRSHCNEKPAHRNEEWPPLTTTREPTSSNADPTNLIN